VVSYSSRYYLKKEKGLAEIFITTAGNFVKTRENVYFQKKNAPPNILFYFKFLGGGGVCGDPPFFERNMRND
jgi:hypothetical protein